MAKARLSRRFTTCRAATSTISRQATTAVPRGRAMTWRPVWARRSPIFSFRPWQATSPPSHRRLPSRPLAATPTRFPRFDQRQRPCRHRQLQLALAFRGGRHTHARIDDGSYVRLGRERRSSMTVTGTEAKLNAALNGLVYTPTGSFPFVANLQDDLQFAFNDANNNQTGMARVSITVTAPPTVAVSWDGRSPRRFQRVNSDLGVGLRRCGQLGYGHTDGGQRQAHTRDDHRTDLQLGFQRLVLDDGDRHGAEPADRSFRPCLRGRSEFHRFRPAADHGCQLAGQFERLGDGANCRLFGSRDPGSSTWYVSVGENSSSQISIFDPAAFGTSDSLTLSVTNGLLSFLSTSGLTFTSGSNYSPSMTVNGTLANMNVALAKLYYVPTDQVSSSSDTLQLSLVDASNHTSSTVALPIAVSIAPQQASGSGTTRSSEPQRMRSTSRSSFPIFESRTRMPSAIPIRSRFQRPTAQSGSHLRCCPPRAT